MSHGLSPTEQRLKAVGRFTTKGAMGAQFALAGLLTDHLIRKQYENPDDILRTLAFVLFGYAAYSGKERLISFFNASSFVGLAAIDKKKCCQALNILNHLWSLIPSLGFAYLTKYALMQSAVFIRTYKGADGWQENVPEVLAQVVEHAAVIAVLGSCSFICNILSFPGIHERGLSFFKNMVQHLFATSQSLESPLSLESAFVARMNPLFASFTELMKAKREAVVARDSEDAGSVASSAQEDASHGSVPSTETIALLTTTPAGRSPAQLKEMLFTALRQKLDSDANVSADNCALLDFYEQKSDASIMGLLLVVDATMPSPSVAWSKASTCIGLLAALLCALGLSNFYSIGEGMSADFFAVSAKLSETASAVLNQVMGAVMMLSMTCMSMHVGLDTQKLFERLAPTRKHVYPQILDKTESMVKTTLFAHMMAALGGGPNIYQSMVMTKQPLPYIFAAEFSSWALEYSGFDALTRGEYEHAALERLIKDDIELARLYRLFMRIYAIDPVNPSVATPEVKPLVAKAPATASCWAGMCWKRDSAENEYVDVEAGGGKSPRRPSQIAMIRRPSSQAPVLVAAH